MIKVVPYQPAWPRLFEEEAKRIRARFRQRAIRIDHVGSTSVPGLSAKPVIDIQVSVSSLEPQGAFTEDMVALGYAHVDLGEFDLVYPFFTRPAQWPSTHHVHLCVTGSEQERNHLAFRDFLRAHEVVAAQYLLLKQQLAAVHLGDTLESREAYSLAKTEFVQEILGRALAQGYPLPGESDG
jgi:GrpB-like predicted nucleotidyltransferase (UPF0157 family)